MTVYTDTFAGADGTAIANKLFTSGNATWANTGGAEIQTNRAQMVASGQGYHSVTVSVPCTPEKIYTKAIPVIFLYPGMGSFDALVSESWETYAKITGTSSAPQVQLHVGGSGGTDYFANLPFDPFDPIFGAPVVLAHTVGLSYDGTNMRAYVDDVVYITQAYALSAVGVAGFGVGENPENSIIDEFEIRTCEDFPEEGPGSGLLGFGYLLGG